MQGTSVLFNTTPVLHRERIADTMHGRAIYENEKHCLNCLHYSNCWDYDEEVNIHAIRDTMPQGFDLIRQSTQSEWTWEKFLTYMQEIIAGHCEAFASRHSAIREEQQRHAAAREANRLMQEKIAKQKETGFDI